MDDFLQEKYVPDKPKFGVGHNSKAEWQDRTRQQRIKSNTPFDIRWQWELFLGNLSASVKLVGLAMRLFGTGKDEKITPSISTISMMTGLQERTVRWSISALLLHQYIDGKRSKGRVPSEFSLTIPDQPTRQDQPGLNPAKSTGVESPTRQDSVGLDDLTRQNNTGLGGQPGKIVRGSTRQNSAGLSPTRQNQPGLNAPTRQNQPGDLTRSVVVDDGNAREREDLVHVNGVGINGPWFTLDNETIRCCGELNRIPEGKRKVLAELIARRWVAINHRPVSVTDALSRAMARQRVNMETDEARIRTELEKLQSDQSNSARMAKTSTPGPRDWRDEQRERERQSRDAAKRILGD